MGECLVARFLGAKDLIAAMVVSRGYSIGVLMRWLKWGFIESLMMVRGQGGWQRGCLVVDSMAMGP